MQLTIIILLGITLMAVCTIGLVLLRIREAIGQAEKRIIKNIGLAYEANKQESKVIAMTDEREEKIEYGTE